MNNKQLGIIFLITFALNAIWENIHSVLYVHYQGAAITEIILLRAALVDAILISVVIILSSIFPQRIRFVVFIVTLFIIAACIEWWALATNRWQYALAMPIVPLLKIGLTPFLQLAITGHIAQFVYTRLDGTRSVV